MFHHWASRVSIYGRHRYRLRLGEPNSVGVELVKDPHLSLLLLLTTRSSSSAVGRTAHSARAAVRRPGRLALRPVLSCAQRLFPDTAATPIPPVADVSVDEQVQRLRDLPGDAMVDDLIRTFGPELPAEWRPPADVPRRWLHAYAAATADGWSAVSPRWRRAQPLLDLEARRVGAAVVRGCTDVLLNALHPRIRYENGEIWVPATRELTVGLDGRRLVLIPTIAGGAGRLVSFDLPGVVYLAYPVPGQASLGGRRAASPPTPGTDNLGRVIGGTRAGVLRAAAGAITMGQLAAAVGCSPRMTTYHCIQLEAAGLIVRERHGQSVWVSRTVRGHELIDLLSK